jgi:hypothetical protein
MARRVQPSARLLALQLHLHNDLGEKMYPSSSTPSLGSQNDVEMVQLSKIPSSPDSYKDSGAPQSLPQDDDDDYEDDRDGGERALLSEDTPSRWKEPLDAAAIWKQTSGIVVEVSASSCRRPAFADLGP